MKTSIDDLLNELRGAGLDARADAATRVLYSTDVLIYQMLPQAVVIPRHTDELQAVMQACARYGVPVTARAGQQPGRAGGRAGGALDCARP